MLRERILLPKPALRVQALFTLQQAFPLPIHDHPFQAVFLEYVEKDVYESMDENERPLIPLRVVDQMRVGPPITDAEKWSAACIISGNVSINPSQTTVLEWFEKVEKANLKSLLSRPEIVECVVGLRKDIHSSPNHQSCFHQPAVFTIPPNSSDSAPTEPTVSEAIAAAKEIFVHSGIPMMDLYELSMCGVSTLDNASETDTDDPSSKCVWLYPPFTSYELESEKVDLEERADRDLARGLVNAALERPLTGSQSNFVLEQMKRHPRFLYWITILPEQLSILIENNPTLAAEGTWC
ncbi:hypothetical protein HDU97_009175 [Phlyctochytrium planicorne]|nr:hypothetical protein HDU97_009175 [Phlyctochytrium planicorne]